MQRAHSVISRAAVHFPGSELQRREFLLKMYQEIRQAGLPPELVPRSRQLVAAGSVMGASLNIPGPMQTRQFCTNASSPCPRLHAHWTTLIESDSMTNAEGNIFTI